MTRKIPVPTLMFVAAASPRLSAIIDQAVTGGVNAVYFRDGWDECQPPSRDDVFCIVPPAAAANCQADAVHYKELAIARLSEPRPLVAGCSVHSVDAAIEAQRRGAGYVIAGTIYESASHRGGVAAGAPLLRAICASVTIPVIAIGGVTPERVAECVDAGAAGVAVRSALLTAADPRAVASEFRAALDAAFVRTAGRTA